MHFLRILILWLEQTLITGLYTITKIISLKILCLLCCDAASAVFIKFDFIISNPPYLPDLNKTNQDGTIDGGPTGIEYTLHFVRIRYFGSAKAREDVDNYVIFVSHLGIRQIDNRIELKEKDHKRKEDIF